MRPKPSKYRAVSRLAERLGFKRTRGSGSHQIFRHADGRRIVIPSHPGDMKTRTLKGIISDLGISVEEFNRNV